MKKIIQFTVVLSLLFFCSCLIGTQVVHSKEVFASKAELVGEINTLKEKGNSLLASSGKVAPEGYKYYLPNETAALFEIYQEIQVRLNYLRTGKWQYDFKWQGYRLVESPNQPSVQVVTEILTQLNQKQFPDSFWSELKIFLLPYMIPQISGLGGAGYVILGAIPAGQVFTDLQLEVTLLHELGHHLHSLYMSNELLDWQNYLSLRGGKWHDSGRVNTRSWSDSTVETFAEDFRMLFGSNQPYYDDLTLGDPRVQPGLADNLKKLILKEMQGEVSSKQTFMFIPDGFWMTFWLNQYYLLLISWGFLLILMFHSLIYSTKNLKVFRTQAHLESSSHTLSC